MEFRADKVLDNIHNCTPQAIKFIREWFDENEYVTAQTSGSTGKPKSISLLKKDMIFSAKSTNEYFNITNKSVLLCPLSADYIAGKMMIVRAIVSGAQLWMETPSNAPVIMDYGRISLIAVVPPQVQHLLDNSHVLNNLDNILIGGAQLSPELTQNIVNAGANAFVSYGMTETCSHVALRKITNVEDNAYEAMPDIFFTNDEKGCLVVNSRTRSFSRLATNDIATIIDSRHFKWNGRFDNVINSGGIKVYPEEIECQIQKVIPKNIEFYIAKCTDKKWGEVPILVISKDTEDRACMLESVRNCVNLKAQRPVHIIVRDIKHTSSGKIIRETFTSE